MTDVFMTPIGQMTREDIVWLKEMGLWPLLYVTRGKLPSSIPQGDSLPVLPSLEEVKEAHARFKEDYPNILTLPEDRIERWARSTELSDPDE